MARATTLLYYLPLMCLYTRVVLVSPSPATADEVALLSFKSMLSGPSSLLASWNSSSHYCTWPGVACSRRHRSRVVSLLMDSFNLSGRLSPLLGNLSFLEELDLRENQLVGQIPSELGHLGSLRVLNLSTNHLQGTIPPALGGCTNLRTLDLSNNQLQGEIPTEIGTMKYLVNLFLHRNGLSGEIPASLTELPSIEYLNMYNNMLFGDIPPALGNLTNIRVIDLDFNMLSGVIPSSLGMLSNLSWLHLAFNNLSGLIPASVWNISSLMHLSMEHNMLSGMMPQDAFAALHNLQDLTMDHNQFHGRIPASLANASDMRFFQITDNFFGGTVPPEVGRLTNLNYLVLADTFLEAKGPKDWEFITALTNCSQLTALVLGNCKFGGVLPGSIFNLSTSLTILQLAINKITGPIPKDIGNLIGLQDLELNSNFFTGYLPSSFSRLKNLALLYVFENRISGSIPSTMGNLTELNYLYLSSNAFSGRIPNSFGNLTKLLELGLSSNKLSGSIPNGLFNITTLSTVLDLSHNSLEGSIPQEIGNLQNLVELRLGSNRLSGQIPTNIGECQLLQNIHLQNNFLMGSIPSLLSQLRGLQILDLSSNNLSGQIPKFLGNLTMLYYLNLSFNSFVGEVPTVGVFANATAISLQGNGKLCGGKPYLHFSACSIQLPKKQHNLVAIPVAISLVATLIVLSLLYKLLTWHKKSKSKTPSITSMQGHPSISYSQLVRATDGFWANNLLGSGSFGSVYKGELDGQVGECTNIVAIKVLKLQTPGALKSFIAECNALRKLRHRNLVKIFTVCSSIDNRGNDFKAIVFDFMPNGGLESWLHPDENEQKYLNLHRRVSILLDVANALDYLHCQGPTPVVHCDLKPSNVLLDAEMVAHVGDFGLAKILVEGNSFLQQSTSSMGFRGTIGYAPPEYGAGNIVSTHGDIYSYGILVLETVTGKRPTDSKFLQGLSLREHVELGLNDRPMDVVDAQLSLGLENELHTVDDSSYRRIDCLISLLRLGLSCSQDMPANRMSTGDIINELVSIKQHLL